MDCGIRMEVQGEDGGQVFGRSWREESVEWWGQRGNEGGMRMVKG